MRVKRERQREREREICLEEEEEEEEEERCNDSRLRGPAWMLLAPFDDRKLLIEPSRTRPR